MKRPNTTLPLMVLVTRHKTMTLEPDELMRRFLLHFLSSARRGRHFALLKSRSQRQSAVSSVQPLCRKRLDEGSLGVLDPNTGSWSQAGALSGEIIATSLTVRLLG